jgi:hypothetical protein
VAEECARGYARGGSDLLGGDVVEPAFGGQLVGRRPDVGTDLGALAVAQRLRLGGRHGSPWVVMAIRTGSYRGRRRLDGLGGDVGGVVTEQKRHQRADVATVTITTRSRSESECQ